MSGGSLNYLYEKFLWGGLFENVDDELRRVRDELLKLGHAEASADVRQLLSEIERVMILGRGLAPLMRAIEWYLSSDYAADDVAKAVAEWEAIE